MIPAKIGSMIPLIRHSSVDLGRIHLQDWHHTANYILADLKEMQQHECLYWEYEGQPVRLHIPIMYIIGDIEGHDKLCTRKGNHQINGVTHSCNVERNHSGIPTTQCQLYKKNEIDNIQKMCMNVATDPEVRNDLELKMTDMGFHPFVKNAFFNLDYGSNENGLHGACAICLLHTFKLKYPDIAVQEYLKMFGITENTAGRLQVNASIPMFVESCKRQSDRDFPKLNTFSFSLTKGKFGL